MICYTALRKTAESNTDVRKWEYSDAKITDADLHDIIRRQSVDPTVKSFSFTDSAGKLVTYVQGELVSE